MFVVERGAFALYLWRSFLYGAAVAAAYMLTGLWRIPMGKMKKTPALILTAVSDLVFCLAAGFFGTLLVYNANRGQMRIAALIFFIAGFLACYLPLRRPVGRIEKKLLSAIYRKVLLPVLRFFARRGRAARARLRRSYEKKRKKREEKRKIREKRKTEKQQRKDIQNEGLQSSAHTDRGRTDHRFMHHHDHRTAASDE